MACGSRFGVSRAIHSRSGTDSSPCSSRRRAARCARLRHSHVQPRDLAAAPARRHRVHGQQCLDGEQQRARAAPARGSATRWPAASAGCARAGTSCSCCGRTRSGGARSPSARTARPGPSASSAGSARCPRGRRSTPRRTRRAPSTPTPRAARRRRWRPSRRRARCGSPRWFISPGPRQPDEVHGVARAVEQLGLVGEPDARHHRADARPRGLGDEQRQRVGFEHAVGVHQRDVLGAELRPRRGCSRRRSRCCGRAAAPSGAGRRPRRRRRPAGRRGCTRCRRAPAARRRRGRPARR